MRAALPAALALSALSLFWGLQGLPRQWPEAEPQAALPQLQQPVHELLRAPRTQPMYLLLTVEGLAYCAEGESAPEVVDNATLERYCARHGLDNAQRLGELLERIEPGGAAGKIQVGYVITTKLLSQFQRAADGQWQFDPAPLARELRLVEKLDRPVALYLSSTHFDTLGPLPAELAKDAANLALFADRQPRTLDYFSYPIVPYTLDPNPELAVNRYKRQALQQVHTTSAARTSAVTSPCVRLVGVGVSGLWLMGASFHKAPPEPENRRRPGRRPRPGPHRIESMARTPSSARRCGSGSSPVARTKSVSWVRTTSCRSLGSQGLAM